MSAPPLPAEAARPNALLGILFKVTATLIFASLAALVKHLSDRYPVGEIVFCRSAFAIIPVAVLLAVSGERLSLLRTARPLGHVYRAVAGTLGMFTFFATISLLPLPDATALSFSAPLFVVALAALILGERVGPYRIGAVLAGFLGVLLVAQPHAFGDPATLSRLGVALGLASAFFIALALTFLRALSLTERSVTTVFYFTLASSVLSGLTLPFWFVWPTPGDALLLVLSGIMGGIGQLVLTQSYRFAEASSLAPFDYAQLLWAMLLGALLFSEFPKPVVLAGAAIIAASGIFIVWRERWLARRAPPAPPELKA